MQFYTEVMEVNQAIDAGAALHVRPRRARGGAARARHPQPGAPLTVKPASHPSHTRSCPTLILQRRSLRACHGSEKAPRKCETLNRVSGCLLPKTIHQPPSQYHPSICWSTQSMLGGAEAQNVPFRIRSSRQGGPNRKCPAIVEPCTLTMLQEIPIMHTDVSWACCADQQELPPVLPEGGHRDLGARLPVSVLPTLNWRFPFCSLRLLDSLLMVRTPCMHACRLL